MLTMFSIFLFSLLNSTLVLVCAAPYWDAASTSQIPKIKWEQILQSMRIKYIVVSTICKICKYSNRKKKTTSNWIPNLMNSLNHFFVLSFYHIGIQFPFNRFKFIRNYLFVGSQKEGKWQAKTFLQIMCGWLFVDLKEHSMNNQKSNHEKNNRKC